MGSNNSRRSRRMGDRAEGGASQSSLAGGSSGTDGDDEPNLATILSYLIRSGQVRIVPSGQQDYDDDDLDTDDSFHGVPIPEVDREPDLNQMEDSEFKQQVLIQSGCCNGYATLKTKPSLLNMIRKREVGGLNSFSCFTPGDCCVARSCFLPNHVDKIAQFHSKAFCGVYSQEGDIFLSACQDQNIRIYDTKRGKFKLKKCIRARDVGWSILDVAFSPDGNFLIYSSWSDCIHLCNITGEQETHDALNLQPGTAHSFAAFSVTFSQDNKEIMAGTNEGCIYVFDRASNQRSWRIDAHEDDINAVAFADASSQILYSGGDDGLVKVWDRRSLNEDNPVPVGILAGHVDGITFIDSKNDDRYLISNCKDQTIKLWDIRKFSSESAQQATRRAVSKQNWDYRWQQVPRKARKKVHIAGDTSLMTYRGHSVLHTLVRARFSPVFTTGQRYIYSGCATGAVVVYDVLTGDIVKRLDGHRACVRDCSWHPYEHTILSTSWDGGVGKWTYSPKVRMSSDIGDDSDPDDDTTDDEGCPTRRKSTRTRTQSDTRRTNRRFLFT